MEIFSPHLWEQSSKIFSLKVCKAVCKAVRPINVYFAELHHGCNQLKHSPAGLAIHLGEVGKGKVAPDKFTLQLHGITLMWVNMKIEFAII